MWGREVLLVSFALIALGSTTKCPKRKTSPAKEIFCYTFTYDAEQLADSVCSCTTLVHQNHDIRNLSISDIADLRKSLREMHPPLQFAISIYDPEKTLRTSAMLRQEAIAKIIAVMEEVDGVELNVTAGSKERLYNFIKSLKDEMIRKSYDKRIFVTLPSKSEDLGKQFDLKELAKYVDLFTLPTDYLTDEDSTYVTFHPSRLMGLFDILNTDSLVDLTIGLGAPKRKILMSLPANAYQFTLKDESENVPRSETTEKEPIPISRKQLCEAITNGEWTVERDEDLTAPYAFRNKTWISFEDKISVGIKGKYAFLRDLAGLAVRNVENDMKTQCEQPVTHEIYHSFAEFKRKSRHTVLNALEDELHQAQFSYPNEAKTSNFRVSRKVDAEGHIRAVRESTQTEFVCRRQGYFVHPKSCNRFYRCVKFNQEIEDYSVFEFDCPAGLSFDERTEVCVWPGSLPQGSPCPGSSEIAPVAPKRFECPSRSGYYADPQNCRWFFACMDLGGPEPMAFEFRCPYGLVFDETKLVCEWPWLVPACSESGSAYARTEYNYGGYTAETSSGFGTGGYVTGSIPEYSVTSGAGYSGADYSKTTDAGIRGASGPNYFGYTTGHAGGQTGISTSGTFSGHGEFSSSSADGYSRSTGQYGGSVPVSSGHGEFSSSSADGYSRSTGQYGGSVPVSSYPGSHDIRLGSVSPGVVYGGSTRYPTASSGIGSTGHTVSGAGYSTGGVGYSGYAGGVNTEYTESGGIATGISGSTAGGYSGAFGGDHFTGQGVTYSGTFGSNYPDSTANVHTGSVSGGQPVPGVSYPRPGASYPGSTANVHTGSVSGGQPVPGVSYPRPGASYPGPTESHRPSPDVHVSSKYDESTSLHAGSSTFNAGGYSTSTNAYAGATGRQPSSSVTGSLYGSVPELPYPGVTGGVGITGSIDGGYRGSTEYSKATDRNSGGSVETGHVTGTSFAGDVSKPGPSYIPRRPDVTTADNSYIRGSTQFSGATGSTRGRYDYEDGYTVPVFIQPEEPIYPSIGTTGAGGRVTDGYSQSDLARPHLNVSIYKTQYPTGYNVHSTSDQGAIVTGGIQPGYISTSSGTPGYVNTDGMRKVDFGSNEGTIIYGVPSPGVSLTGPSTSGVVRQGGVTPNVAVSGQPTFGVSLGGSTQPGAIVSATGKPYVSQTDDSYQGSVTRGSTSYSSSTFTGGSSFPQTYKPDGGRVTTTFNVPYDTGKYSESDLPDYRPTSATLPDSIVPGGRIDGSEGVIRGSTASGVPGSSTAAPGYAYPKPSVFTPSGFTKTGPTKTGITTAVLGGGGSYTISTSERRPTLSPENIGEKAFDGNVYGYTRPSSIGGISSTLSPPAYSPTPAPGGRFTPPSGTSGYSYHKPSVKFETGGAVPSTTPILPIEGTTPTSFLNVELHNGVPDRTGVFGSRIPSGFPTSTMAPIIYTTKQPDIYKTTMFEAAKIPGVSTARPIIDTGYKTTIVPTYMPCDQCAPYNPVSVSSEDRFTQRTGSQTRPTSNFGSGVSFQRTDSSSKDYSSFTSSSPGFTYRPEQPGRPACNCGYPGQGFSTPSSLEYLPGKTSQSDCKCDGISSTTKYDTSTVTTRPDLVGVTYRKPSPGYTDVTYKSPSSFISPTTFRPTDTYYSGQGFSTPSSLGTTVSGGSPTNLGIPRDEIDKLITNYRGTVRYTPSVYDSSVSSGLDLTPTKYSSPSIRPGSTFAVTSGPTASYEVTTKLAEGKGKVIVKWSDLHPLLLGKLGADCTCKADPFANLRGPGKKKLIESSRGKVDLANYDESDIYVDLEHGGSSEEKDYVTSHDGLPQQPYKISKPYQPNGESVSINLPSSTYLPVSSPTSTRNFAKGDTLSQPNRFQGGPRAGKTLKDISPSPNSITFEEEDDPDQIIDGATNCARPGLFRHPNLCNKFYACYWDQWKKKFTLHIFNCPIHLTFDSSAGACNWPSKGPACQADNLLV